MLPALRHRRLHGPGRGRADDERAADHAVGIARPRYASDALRWTRVAGLRGSVGVLSYKRGSVGPCVCWKGVWGNRVAAGFAKHGSELPRVAFRGLTMSRARLGRATQDLLTHGFSFAFLLDPQFFELTAFQMSVNARRHRLYSCLGGLVGYDVLPSAKLGTSLLHTQKVASSSLASSTFFFFLPPPCP